MVLSDFIIDTSRHQSVFMTEDFIDSAEMHEYAINKKDTENIDKFEALESLYYFYSELYSYAYPTKEEPTVLPVMSIKGAMPIDIEDFYDFISGNKQSDDAPAELIVEISLEAYDTIYSIKDNMMKVLKRDRQLVSIDKAQQFDMQCIYWYVKQPGTTSIEKAGLSQKLKAVVRYESYDTLENRVFKDFLKHSFLACRAYEKEYGERYENSGRVHSVKKLRYLLKSILDMDVMETISNLHSLPIPNYVLQNNPRYRIIWNYYQQLLHKERIIDTLWKNRQIVYRNFVDMSFLSIFHHREIGRDKVKQFLWMYHFPTDKGEYLVNIDNSFSCDFNTSKMIFSKSEDTAVSMKIKTPNTRAELRLQTLLIPVCSGINSNSVINASTVFISEDAIISKELQIADNQRIIDISNDNSSKKHNIVRSIFNSLMEMFK